MFLWAFDILKHNSLIHLLHGPIFHIFAVSNFIACFGFLFSFSFSKLQQFVMGLAFLA